MKNNILLLDIETLPAIAYVWGLWGENIPVERIVEPGRVVCWASKWFGKAGITFSSEWDHGRENMIQSIYNQLCEADAVVTYNGDKFDLPKLMGEFVTLGLGSPGPLTSIDLYKTVRKLGFPSNKLKFVAPHLGIGAKIEHEGFKMWHEVIQGDPAAQKAMEKYNKQDTKLLEDLYKRLRPFIKNHPYLGFRKPTECPACGSRKVQRRGIRRTKSFIIERLHCQSCGAWSDGTRSKVK